MSHECFGGGPFPWLAAASGAVALLWTAIAPDPPKKRIRIKVTSPAEKPRGMIAAWRGRSVTPSRPSRPKNLGPQTFPA
jgi:hypothetical protein